MNLIKQYKKDFVHYSDLKPGDCIRITEDKSLELFLKKNNIATILKIEKCSEIEKCCVHCHTNGIMIHYKLASLTDSYLSTCDAKVISYDNKQIIFT